MIHRNLRYTTGWEWHVLQLPQPIQQAPARRALKTLPQANEQANEPNGSCYELKQAFPKAADWIDASYECTSNNVLLSNVEGHGPVVQGTILFQLSEDSKDIAPFHFWLSSHTLLTMHDDMRIPLRLQNLVHLESYESFQSAPEAFFYMIGVLLESLHVGLDIFEDKLGKLELDIRERNRKGLLDDIIDVRYELLHYNHLYLPIREFEGLTKEAFLESITDTESYMKMQHRFDRIDILLKHYAGEIDTLISVDDAISNFKGNEIIRTLTIFTVVCLPATIFGAVWGSNFEWLPFKHSPLGFMYMMLAILCITGVIYYILWKRGWTGDILQRKKDIKKKKLKAMQPLLELTSHESDTEVLPSRKERNKREKLPLKQLEKSPEYSIDSPLPSRKQK